MILDMLRHDALTTGLLILAILCFVAYWGRWSGQDSISLTGAWVKTGATGLVALALLLDAARSGRLFHAESLVWLMALGLLFGALGDFALARRSERAFLAGMAAFAIGHLIYAFALWAGTQNIVATYLVPDAGRAFAGGAMSQTQIIALIGLVCLLASTELWLAPKTGALRWPVRGYVGVIGAMVAVAILLVESNGTGFLRLGAALFVLSDLLLALGLFVVATPRAKRGLSLALWPAYWLGQMLLMLGAVGYEILPDGEALSLAAIID